jgi:adenylate cyclase
MESCGLPGHIQVTETTFNLLRHQYPFQSRGHIEVKGKGFMSAYLLVMDEPVFHENKHSVSSAAAGA